MTSSSVGTKEAMMSDQADEFLKKLGMKGEQPKDAWLDLIRPTTVSLILGCKGAGKSGLGYFLLDKLSKAHSLLPIAVNLPREKQYLLPADYAIKTLEELKHTQDAIALIDEGTTMLPAGQRKLEEMVKSFVALSRQRHQIIIFIFHASSDVGSRILRGVDAILLKEPSLRQIQYGSKDAFCRALLTEGKERFKSLTDMGEDTRKYTYVDCEKPPYRGMVKNDLPEYWSEELSEAWADVDTNAPLNLDTLLGKPAVQGLSTEERLRHYGVPPELNKAIIEMDRQYNLEELRAMCREKGLPTSGDKKKLASQLIMAEENNGK